jgi:hypothetical protein
MSNVHLDAKKKRRISRNNQQEERMEDKKKDQAQAKNAENKGDLTSATRTSRRKLHRRRQSEEPRTRFSAVQAAFPSLTLFPSHHQVNNKVAQTPHCLSGSFIPSLQRPSIRT